MINNIKLNSIKISKSMTMMDINLNYKVLTQISMVFYKLQIINSIISTLFFTALTIITIAAYH